MTSAGHRTRIEPQEITDDWLIDAARRAGHSIPRGPRARGVSAWRSLLSAGLSDEEILELAIAASGTDPADFSRASPALAPLLPHEVALEHRVAPTGVHRGVLGIGTVNPKSVELERVLAFACKQRIALQAASPGDILRAQGVIYGTGGYGTTLDLDSKTGHAQQPPQPPPVVQPRPAPVSRLSVGVPVPTEAAEPAVATRVSASASVNATATAPRATEAPADTAESLLDRLIATALKEHASEAHLEPVPEGGGIVRLRIDGKLNDRFRVSEANALRLARGLKTACMLDPEDTRRAQSGRASYPTPTGAVTLRVSSEPVGIGHERVVVKLFAPQSIRALADLGLSPAEQHRVGQILAVPNGLVIVVGPPASGKTTTLYAMLSDLRKRGKRAATIEESVTCPLDGVQQAEVISSALLTRASAVRATLGSATGAVVVDVANDPEALETIVGSNHANHVALAALSASDMPSAMERFYELQVDLIALSTSLKGMFSQRLVRRLCPACAAPQTVTELPDSQQSLLVGFPTDKLRRPVGCAECRGTGYAGRTMVAEIVPMTPALLAAVAKRADAAELTRVARDEGVTMLWDAGMHCVLQGITTLGELLDNVPAPQEPGASPADQGDIDALLTQLLGSSVMQPAAAAAAAPAAPPPVAPAPARALRVLLADDDVATRRTLAGELRALGVQVTEVADGAAALEYAQRLQPDVVLTEIALPKLDAVGIVQALRAVGPRPVVVVHTSQEDQALHAWLRDAGARDVLSRTLSAEAIVKRLREVVSS